MADKEKSHQDSKEHGGQPLHFKMSISNPYRTLFDP
jgi:hypothetical protein